VRRKLLDAGFGHAVDDREGELDSGIATVYRVRNEAELAATEQRG